MVDSEIYTQYKHYDNEYDCWGFVYGLGLIQIGVLDDIGIRMHICPNKEVSIGYSTMNSNSSFVNESELDVIKRSSIKLKTSHETINRYDFILVRPEAFAVKISNIAGNMHIMFKTPILFKIS